MIDQHAIKYIGTSYRHQGRVPGIGLDCAGVLICSMRDAGYAVNDCRSYSRVPPRNLLQATVESHGLQEVTRGQPQDGDVMLFWMRNKRLVIHCGICTNNGRDIIHVESGRKVEAVPMQLWRHQLAKVFRSRISPW